MDGWQFGPRAVRQERWDPDEIGAAVAGLIEEAPAPAPVYGAWRAAMAEAYIVDALRTPVGRRGGGLAAIHSADLGAHVLDALVERTGIDPAAVDDVVFGCVDTIGPQAGDIARTAWLAAGLPESVSPAPPSTASAAPPSRRSTSPPRG